MASLQVGSPQVEEVCSNAEEQTVMTPPPQNYEIDEPVLLIDDDIEEEDDHDIEIIPRRDQGKQVEDLDDATDQEEDVNGVKPAAQFDDDDDDDGEEPANKGIQTRRFPDEQDEDEDN